MCVRKNVKRRTIMRQIIYDRVASIAINTKNYISTKELLREGLTNRQIANLQEEGYLEKIVNVFLGIRVMDRKNLKIIKQLR